MRSANIAGGRPDVPMTLIYLGFSNNSDGGSFCMIIANIAGGRPDDASLRDSLPYRSAGQPGRLPRHCQVTVIVTVVVIVRLLPWSLLLSLLLSLSCNCLCLVIVWLFVIVFVRYCHRH